MINKRGGGHKGEGDGIRVQGRVIHTKEKETGSGSKGGLFTQRGGGHKGEGDGNRVQGRVSHTRSLSDQLRISIVHCIFRPKRFNSQ